MNLHKDSYLVTLADRIEKAVPDQATPHALFLHPVDWKLIALALRKMHGPSPASRSAAAFPSNYRQVLEASNLPIEVATAIADRLDGPDGELLKKIRDAAVFNPNRTDDASILRGRLLVIRDLLDGCHATSRHSEKT